jgi:hypothetical protein
MPLIGSGGCDGDWEQPATTIRPQYKSPESNASLLMPYSTGDASRNNESQPGPNPRRVFNHSRGQPSSKSGRTRTEHDENNGWPAGIVRRTWSGLRRISLTIRVWEDMCQVRRSKIVKIFSHNSCAEFWLESSPHRVDTLVPISVTTADHFPPPAIGGFRECHGVAAS